jgi:hypothetical protein
MGAALVERSADRVHVSFPILDGLAVAAPGGRLLLAAERVGSEVRVGVRVDGYTPRLYRPRALPARLLGLPYAAVQNRVHDRVTGRFLDALGGPS